jgi:hypothetical protein
MKSISFLVANPSPKKKKMKTYIYIEIWDSAKKPGKKTKLSVWINIWLNHDKSQYIATPK